VSLTSEEKAGRVEAVRAAMLHGVRKYMPNVQHADLSTDAVIDLQEKGILDYEEPKFQEFLDGLRNPGPPTPVEQADGES
jgi:hypothetical protein